MPFDLEEFTQVFAPNDYIEVGFRQDSQSVAQLEKLLSKYFKQRQQYDEQQTQKNQKSFLDAIKELKSKQNNELEKLKQLFSDVGNNINLSMKNSGENNRIILQRVAKVAQVVLKGVEKQYAAGKKWVQTLSDLDEAGIITKNGFEEIREAATTAGLGLDEFKSVLLKSTKTISKFEAATGQGIISYGKAMKTLLDSGRYTARESAAMIDSYVGSIHNLDALKGKEFEEGLNKYAKTTKMMAMLQGEQVDHMLALKKEKSDNLAIQGRFNSNQRLSEFKSLLGPMLADANITDEILANWDGLKTVGVAESVMARQSGFKRTIENLYHQFNQGLIDSDTLGRLAYEAANREYKREIQIGKNTSYTSVAANAPFFQNRDFSLAKAGDKYLMSYDEMKKKMEEDNESNQAKSWSRRFLRSLNNIFTNKDYLTTGGTQAYLGVLKPITESTELASTAIDGFASGLSKLNKTIGEMEEGWGKYAAQLGLATGTGIVRGVGEYTTAQVGSYINSLIEGGSHVGGAYLIKQGLQSAAQGGKSNWWSNFKNSAKKIKPSNKVSGWTPLNKMLAVAGALENGYSSYNEFQQGNYGYASMDAAASLAYMIPGLQKFGMAYNVGKTSGDWIATQIAKNNGLLDKGHILTPEEAKANWERVMGSSYQNINQPTYSEINKSKTVEAEEQKTQVTQSLNDSEILKEMKTTLNLIYDWLSRKYMNEIQTQTRFTPYNVNT